MAAVIHSIFPRLFYFQLFSVIMILAPGVNALADWVVRGATTLHKLVAPLMILVVQNNQTMANFEPWVM